VLLAEDQQSLKNGVGEAWANSDIVEQSLDVIDDDKRERTLVSILENLCDFQAL
jgi:hypothetical protein